MVEGYKEIDVVRGIFHGNIMLDNTVYGNDGNMQRGRARVFASRNAILAAQLNGKNWEDGELARFDLDTHGTIPSSGSITYRPTWVGDTFDTLSTLTSGGSSVCLNGPNANFVTSGSTIPEEKRANRMLGSTNIVFCEYCGSPCGLPTPSMQVMTLQCPRCGAPLMEEG